LLVGSPLSNPWVGLFQDQLDFVFKYDLGRNEEVIENTRPAAGESRVYVPTVPGWGTGQGFAIVALVGNQNQTGHVLIIAGSNAAATAAAGKFVTDTKRLAEALQAHRLDPYNQDLRFEALLRITTVATSINTFEGVTCHGLNAPNRFGRQGA
jgi:hypothetical protein